VGGKRVGGSCLGSRRRLIGATLGGDRSLKAALANAAAGWGIGQGDTAAAAAAVTEARKGCILGTAAKAAAVMEAAGVARSEPWLRRPFAGLLARGVPLGAAAPPVPSPASRALPAAPSPLAAGALAPGSPLVRASLLRSWQGTCARRRDWRRTHAGTKPTSRTTGTAHALACLHRHSASTGRRRQQPQPLGEQIHLPWTPIAHSAQEIWVVEMEVVVEVELVAELEVEALQRDHPLAWAA